MRPVDHSSIFDISFVVLLISPEQQINYSVCLPRSGKAYAKPNRRNQTDKWSATFQAVRFQRLVVAHAAFAGVIFSAHHPQQQIGEPVEQTQVLVPVNDFGVAPRI